MIYSSLLYYNDVIMGAIASQITSLAIVYSTVYSGADQRKHVRFASLAFVRGIHRGPVNSPHKWPVTPKMFPFDDVIMVFLSISRRSMSICGGINPLTTVLKTRFPHSSIIHTCDVFAVTVVDYIIYPTAHQIKRHQKNWPRVSSSFW